MVRKGNLAVFESSDISETGEDTPTKIGVHECDINPYMHEYSPWSKREIWPNLKLFLSSFFLSLPPPVSHCVLFVRS